MISLKTCADLLADAPNCLAFLAAWQRWRGDDPVPSVDRIKPEELGRALNGLSILEVHSPERSQYRLVGASHIQAMGRDLTGEEVASVTPKNGQTQRMQGLWTMVSVPCGAIAELSYVRQSGFRTPTRRLVLPATPKSPGGAQRLYVAVDMFGGQAMRDDPPAGPVELTEEVTYVDIGRGAPE
ncbi:MAG: PAS domain-containing protein [Alphaproteobacteria bacterium]|nr:PAS domain-containing protein [Alphaproteobacteria bacterium]